MSIRCIPSTKKAVPATSLEWISVYAAISRPIDLTTEVTTHSATRQVQQHHGAAARAGAALLRHGHSRGRALAGRPQPPLRLAPEVEDPHGTILTGGQQQVLLQSLRRREP